MALAEVLLVLGAMLAGFVQGLTGFGFSMVAMAVWSWVLPPQLAAILAVFGGLTGQLLSAATVRRGFSLQRLWPFLAGGLAGVPLGVWLLPLLDMQWFKLLLGVFLVLWCPAMLLSSHLPHVRAGGRPADGLIGIVGGVMGGIGGFSGAIPSLWCTLRGYAKDEQRAVIQNFNLTMLIVAMSGHVATGAVTRDMLPYFLWVLPAILIPSVLGARLYVGISEQAFKRLVLGVLTAVGIALLWSSVPAVLAG